MDFSVDYVKPTGRSKPKVTPCDCEANDFPHRAGSGSCPIGKHPVCTECGRICKTTWDEMDAESISENCRVALVLLASDGENSHCCGAPVAHTWEEWVKFNFWGRKMPTHTVSPHNYIRIRRN